MDGLTRRRLLQGVLALPFVPPLMPLLLRGAQAQAAGDVRRLLQGFQRGTVFGRRYRVDATVLFLGIPLLTRQNAGGGFAVVETGGTDGASAVALQFSAGSLPERAAGLNRFGAIEEGLVDRPEGSEGAFAGLITSTQEESFGDAKKALKAGTKAGTKPVSVTLMRGRSGAAGVEVWVGKETLPSDSTWKEANKALEVFVRDQPPEDPPRRTAAADPGFLFAMRKAGLSSERTFRQPFLHAGKAHVLETTRHPGAAEELNGVIRTAAGSKAAEFHVFYQPGDESGLPARIEYRAKSYLKLTFHSEDGGAPVPTLFA